MEDPGPGPEPQQRPRRPGRPARAYSVFVGLAFAAIVGIAAVNLLRTDERGIIGVDREGVGEPLAAFAVPDALGPLEGDANIAQDDCASSARPCPAADRRTPACRVEGDGVIRVCDLFDRPLVISFWFTRGGECTAQQDVFDAVAERYPGRVNFLGLNVRDSRERVREIAAERGWDHALGHDRDGALSNLYRVGGCPTFLYAYPGGILREASIGELGAAELSAKVDELVGESARRARTDR